MNHDKGYFDIHIAALKLLGLGVSSTSRAYKIYSLICISVNIFGYLASETIFAFKVWNDDRESSLQFLAFTMVGVHFFAVLKMLILIKNHKIIANIVEVLQMKSDEFHVDAEIEKYSKKATKIVTGCFLIVGELTITCMCIYTIIVDSERKKKLKESNYELQLPRDTPFTAYVPWDVTEDLPYAVAFMYCTFGMYWMGTALMFCDTLIASIMVHISGQFQMVQRMMENVEIDALKSLVHSDGRKHQGFSVYRRNAKCFTDEDFDEAVLRRLKQAIKYHQLIIGITYQLQAAYSQAFLCQTLSSLYVIGLILVQTAQDVSNVYSLRLFNNLGFLFAILWQLFIQTYGANEITFQAMKVSESAYKCSWYNLGRNSIKIRKILTIVLIRSQQPIYLTAGNFAAMNNSLFVSIIRSAYQIFTLITTVMSRDK